MLARNNTTTSIVLKHNKQRPGGQAATPLCFDLSPRSRIQGHPQISMNRGMWAKNLNQILINYIPKLVLYYLKLQLLAPSRSRYLLFFLFAYSLLVKVYNHNKIAPLIFYCYPFSGGAYSPLFESNSTDNVELVSLSPDTHPVPECWKSGVRQLPDKMRHLVATSFEDSGQLNLFVCGDQCIALLFIVLQIPYRCCTAPEIKQLTGGGAICKENSLHMRIHLPKS